MRPDDWQRELRAAVSAVEERLVPRVAADDQSDGPATCWSPRDVLGHLTAWSDLLIDEIEVLVQDRPETLAVIDIDSWNAREVAERRSWTSEQAIAAWRRAVQRAETVVGGVPADAWERRWAVPWSDKAVSIGEIVGLWLVHIQQHR